MTLAQGHLHLKIRSCFSQLLLGHLEPNFVGRELKNCFIGQSENSGFFRKYSSL